MVKLARLRQARERAALSQEDLASRAGITMMELSRLESGAAEPQPSTVRKLAEELGVEPAALMAMAAEGPEASRANEPMTGYERSREG